MGVNETVLQYLKDSNRPYNANDIAQNLHKQFSKASIQKALDYHVEKGRVIEKVYGKQKIYAIKQAKFNRAEFEARQAQLKAKHDEQESQISREEANLKALEARLKEYKHTVTTSYAQEQKDALLAQYAEMKSRHEQLTKNSHLITDIEKKRIILNVEQMEKQWRVRRRMALDMLDAILENWPKDKKSLYEEIGVETDQDVGVVLPSKQ